MIDCKVVTVALLGAPSTGKKSLAAALTQALSSTLLTPLHWQINTDTALQRLLERDGADLDAESPELQEALAQQRRFDHRLLLGLDFELSAQSIKPQRSADRRRLDMQLRHSLTQADAPFKGIYGLGENERHQRRSALRR